MSDLAVVIPVLDRAATIETAIVSAVEANFHSEIVIADCGSTDGTLKVARSFEPRVQVIQGRFPNAAAARNAGAAVSSAPNLAFLDSDDLMLPGKAAALRDALTSDSSFALVHGATQVITSDGSFDPVLTEAQRRGRLHALETGTSYAGLARYCAMYMSATLIRRAAFEEVGGFDETLNTYEDWDLYLRLSLVGELRYADVPAARYRVWPGNVSWDRTATGVVQVARKHLAALGRVPPDQQKAAEFGFQCRLAGSHYTLLQLGQARSAAISAVRLDPRRALAAPEVRRALTRWVIPRRILRDRRGPRTTDR